ncbi:GtrA family protein [Propionicimonas paludicola]|uniref:GtrA family protein n=1 Tax=Propionicimonas paludicola TaxID=185243 RepID=UPI000BF57795|nr:GtrA family protein [Propionicimonas paludicola]
MSEPQAPARAPLARQLTRFVISGGISAVVDFGLLNLLMAVGLGPSLAKALSFIAGTTTAYLINRRWTFEADPSKRRFAAVVALYGLTFAVQVGLWTLCYPWLLATTGSDAWARIGGFVIAQGVATTVNFVVQRSLIFR